MAQDGTRSSNEPAGRAFEAVPGRYRLPTAFAVYLLLTSVLAWSLPIPEIAKAALAVPALALMPLLLGGALLRCLPFLDEALRFDGFCRALVEWLAGSLVLTTLAVVLQLGGQAFLLRHFGPLALALAVGGCLAVRALPARPMRLRLGGGAALALAGAVLLSMTPKIVAARVTPFPLVADNFLDPLLFAQPALRMMEHGYLGLENPSHPPGLVTLTAITAQLYDVDPLSVLWMGPFLMLAVFGAGLLLWGEAICGRWASALLVTAVGLFILTGNASFSGTPLELRSNRILFALFPLGLYLTHRLVSADEAPRRGRIEALFALQGTIAALFVAMNVYRFGLFSQGARIPLMLAVAAALGLLLAAANARRWRWAGLSPLFAVIVAFQVFHVFEGPVYLTGLVIYGLALTLRGLRTEGLICAGACLVVAAYFLLQYAGIASFPPDFSLSSAVFGSTYESVPVSFSVRVGLLADALSPAVVVLMLTGAAACLTGRAGPAGRAVVTAAAIMFLAYLLPDAFAYRTNKGMVPFLAFLVVVGAGTAGELTRQAARWAGTDRPLLQPALQIGLVAAVLPALVVPFMEHTTSLRPGDKHRSGLADVEYELAAWFRDRTGENARIISDYQTMLVLSSLSNKVSPVERKFLTVEMSAAGREQMLFIQRDLLRAADGCAAYGAIRSLAGSEPAPERRFLRAVAPDLAQPDYFIVWTAKTFLWSRRDGIDPVRRASGDVYPTMVAPFLDPRFFRLAAVIGSQAYVFRVLPAPEPPPISTLSFPSELLSEVLGVTTAPASGCAWAP